MASDGPSHLLSLKVMRVSRPELAAAWQPFYSSSPSFSAHSSASILSLQGSSPLPGHPKTLRDLTHASELLTLPSSFGSIQLGETFSSCLCINNEALTEVELKQVRVEMQTATSKMVLSDLDESGSQKMLRVGDSLETIVHHEIKELGQHVLACAVTYRLPANARPVPGAAEDDSDPSLLTFRKFYKFAVTNPLSVKTKVHTTRSPSASFTPKERDKVFLEVHIQNLAPGAIHFEKMQFECADNWIAQDINSEAIFDRSFATMQSQDTRQYIYILTPKTPSLIAPNPAPGSMIPLGRLDISWRSLFGEPGRLLTSMLTRRIPFPPVQQPVSAIPSYLKRTVAGSVPSRPHSPQSFASRPVSPPPRPASPFTNRPASAQIVRPQSPQTIIAPSLSTHATDLDVTLLLKHLPRENIEIEKPFTATFSLAVTRNLELGRRKLMFAVQHLRPPKVSHLPIILDASSPRLPSSGFSTPMSANSPFNYAIAHQKILDAAIKSAVAEPGADEGPRPSMPDSLLPPPYFEGQDELKSSSDGVIATGPSAIILPAVEASTSEGTSDSPIVQDFQLTFVPIQQGFSTIGGLRILLVEDTSGETDTESHPHKHTKVHTLKEYGVIAEVWAK
ncbi:DUF974-domain-containing protein [Coprinopsis marcescibilis]|uniref:DUF974-domain-containing protein n=1 Tax=Coprinopsis marcescibilis TaxID=230819 RepID=A0A5C3KYX3_COPMA|nr:DUF974-domain-containing protein [Coprinopsis marcescibilis]